MDGYVFIDKFDGDKDSIIDEEKFIEIDKFSVEEDVTSDIVVFDIFDKWDGE